MVRTFSEEGLGDFRLDVYDHARSTATLLLELTEGGDSKPIGRHCHRLTLVGIVRHFQGVSDYALARRVNGLLCVLEFLDLLHQDLLVQSFLSHDLPYIALDGIRLFHFRDV